MTELEFSRPVKLERIGRKPLEQSITATPAECAAVALRLHIDGVRYLSARMELQPAKDGIIAVVGAVTAGVAQICVVGGDAFDSDVSADIRARFTTDPDLVEEFDMDRIDVADEWDDVELVDTGAIDIGELAVQYLSLSLDSYPRKPDAEWRDPQPEGAPVSPFAVLRGLKKD